LELQDLVITLEIIFQVNFYTFTGNFKNDIILDEFKQLPFHEKGIELLKNYEPAIEKLGDKDKLVFKKAEITDRFNYNDGEIGRVNKFQLLFE